MCIKFTSASVVKPFISARKVVQAGNVVVLKESEHSKQSRRHSHQVGREQLKEKEKQEQQTGECEQGPRRKPTAREKGRTRSSTHAVP